MGKTRQDCGVGRTRGVEGICGRGEKGIWGVNVTQGLGQHFSAMLSATKFWLGED
jgi:hypothetical protein